MTVQDCASKDPYSTQIGPFGSSIMAKEYMPSGVPVIRGVNVNHGRFLDNGFVFVSEEKADELAKYESRPGDVLLVHRGTLGKIGLMPSKRKYPRYILGNSMLRVQCDESKLLPEYLYYWLSSPFGQKYLFSRISQVGVPALPSPLATLRQATLLVPPLPEQQGIVKVLGVLDDKIELSQRMNETLEAIAKAIFKHWFVDFEFPNEDGKPYKSSGGKFNGSILGKVPTGWGMTSLDRVADFTRGFSYKGSEKCIGNGEYLFITLNSVKEGGGFKREFSFVSSGRLKERHFVQSGDIVIANTEQTKTGTLLGCPALVEFPLGYRGDRAVISHHITKVVPKQQGLKYFLYYHLLFHQQEAVQYNSGSVIWALDVVNWARQEGISTPPPQLIDSFNRLVDPIMQRFWENNLQAEVLAGLRDGLLPKLMSGKIRVPVGAS